MCIIFTIITKLIKNPKTICNKTNIKISNTAIIQQKKNLEQFAMKQIKSLKNVTLVQIPNFSSMQKQYQNYATEAEIGLN